MNVVDKVRSVVRDYVDALDEDGDLQALVQQAQDLVLLPYRKATSGTAIKTYLSALLFLTTSFSLIGVSSAAYLLFYYNFIPRINLEQTVYLQYGPGVHPYATIPLQSQALISQQQYDIEVVLHMPRTPTNLGAGNFMVDISLLSDKDLASTSPLSYILPKTSVESTKPPLHRSRRPAILPYSSYFTSLSYSVLHLPSHLLKLRDLDSTTLVVPLFERLSFSRGRQNIPTHAYLEIQSQIPQTPAEACPPQRGISLTQGLGVISPSAPEPLRTLQVYTAKLKFRAKFKGLRYIVYNFRVLSFLVFSTLFYFTAILSMGVAWYYGSSRDGNENGQINNSKLPRIKKDGSAIPSSDMRRTIKSEDDSSRLYDVRAEQAGEGGRGGRSDHSSGEGDQGIQTDTSATFPGIGRTVPPLRYPGSARTPAGDEAFEEIAPLQRDDGTNDAEDEDDDEHQQQQGAIATNIKSEEDQDQRRFGGDSGIGTSMESETPGPSLVRRRSGRSSREGRP